MREKGGSGSGIGFSGVVICVCLGVLLWINGCLRLSEEGPKPSTVFVTVNGIEQPISLAQSVDVPSDEVSCVYSRTYRLFTQDTRGQTHPSFVLCCPPGEQPRCEILKWH